MHSHKYELLFTSNLNSKLNVITCFWISRMLCITVYMDAHVPCLKSFTPLLANKKTATYTSSDFGRDTSLSVGLDHSFWDFKIKRTEKFYYLWIEQENVMLFTRGRISLAIRWSQFPAKACCRRVLVLAEILWVAIMSDFMNISLMAE